MIKNKIQAFPDIVLVSTFPTPVSGPRSDSGTLFEAKFWLIFVFFCTAGTLSASLSFSAGTGSGTRNNLYWFVLFWLQVQFLNSKGILIPLQFLSLFKLFFSLLLNKQSLGPHFFFFF